MSENNRNSNEISSTTILELDVDCCEELFEWLSFADLKQLRHTCKRFRVIVDYYIQSTYPKGFGSLQLFDIKEPEYLREFDAANFCKLYKHITFDYYFSVPNHKDKLKIIEPILKNFEKVRIPSGPREGNLQNYILQHCTHMKSLSFSDILDWRSDNDWLLQKMPSLKHFSLMTGYSRPAKIPMLQTFLEQNPNIRVFMTSAQFIEENMNWMKESSVRLDQFDVEICGKLYADVNSTCIALNELFDCGFYKKLYFIIDMDIEQDHLDHIAVLRGIDRLFLNCCSYLSGLVWPEMPQLKEFSMRSSRGYEDTPFYHILAGKMMNIERLSILFSSFDDILPFIRLCAKLKMVRLRSSNGTYYRDGVIDLPALNKVRQECANASKIAMFVNEQAYLATKNALMKTDYSLIGMKRAESHDWGPFPRLNE